MAYFSTRKFSTWNLGKDFRNHSQGDFFSWGSCTMTWDKFRKLRKVTYVQKNISKFRKLVLTIIIWIRFNYIRKKEQFSPKQTIWYRVTSLWLLFDILLPFIFWKTNIFPGALILSPSINCVLTITTRFLRCIPTIVYSLSMKHNFNTGYLWKLLIDPFGLILELFNTLCQQ